MYKMQALQDTVDSVDSFFRSITLQDFHAFKSPFLSTQSATVSHNQCEAPIRQIARNAGEDPSEVQLADGMRRHFGAMATFLGSEKARLVFHRILMSHFFVGG
jgi:hypothetical protein